MQRWVNKIKGGRILRADSNACFSVILSLLLTAGEVTSGTLVISFSFTYNHAEKNPINTDIVVNYYKVNSQCAPNATSLTPGKPHSDIRY